MNRRRTTRIAQQQLRAVLNKLIHHGLLRTEIVIHGPLRNTRPGRHLFNSGVLKPLLGHNLHSSIEQLQLSSSSTAGTTTCSFSDWALQHQKSSLPFCRYTSILLDSIPLRELTRRLIPQSPGRASSTTTYDHGGYQGNPTPDQPNPTASKPA